MREYDIVFNSAQDNGKRFQLAHGFISLTNIYFKGEKIIAKIEAKGSVEFFDNEENLLVGAKVLPQTDGPCLYTSVILEAENEKVTLKFPVVDWIDYYPHCDGEFDRWGEGKIKGYHILSFDLKTNSIK